MSNLVIVESAKKIKNILSALGSDFKADCSLGHITEIEDIDRKNNFDTKYKIKSDKYDKVKQLKAISKDIFVYLASDPDREGEAIAYHLKNELKLKNYKRITFNNTTKKAIQESIKNPRDIDMNLVNAQMARCILDRLIGFDLSNLLQKNFKGSKLSAGRVQSVVLKLIVERENEIKKFASKSYYVTHGQFENNLKGILDKNFEKKDDVMNFLNKSKNAEYFIEDIKKEEKETKALPPYETSSMQIDACNKMHRNPDQIMKYAQSLYESGYITYHRTDSIVLSDEAINQIKSYILENYGEKYLSIKRIKNTAKNTQEAHEAIRPTNIKLTQIEDLSDDEKKLYEMIWKRTVASQMSNSISDILTIFIKISTTNEKYLIKGTKLKFDGFKKVYQIVSNEDDAENIESNFDLLNKLELNQKLNMLEIESKETYSKPPLRYSQASLLSIMKKIGIGRPATYASMVKKNLEDKSGKKYAEVKNISGNKLNYLILKLKDNDITENKGEIMFGSEKNKIIPTELAYEVIDYLDKNFGMIMDYEFTSKVEKDLDEITSGKIQWDKIVKGVYDIYHPIFTKLKSDIPENKALMQYDGKNVYLYNNSLKIDKKYYNIPDEFKNSELNEENIKNIIENKDHILGTYQDHDIEIHKSFNTTYGNKYYLKHNGKNYGIKDKVSLEDAIKIIEEKNNKIIKKIDKDTIIMNGSYGPFILKNKKIISIPKDITDYESITLEMIKTWKPAKKFVKKK